MNRRQLLRFAGWVAAFAAIFFIFLWIGFAVQARKAYRAGEQALSEGAEIMAQGYFERSIRRHCPLNTWGKQSADRLETMAKGYEDKGAIDRAVETYEGLLTALAATDTGWSGKRRQRIDRLEKKVAKLRERLKGTD
jgi:hypothetical protein